MTIIYTCPKCEQILIGTIGNLTCPDCGYTSKKYEPLGKAIGALVDEKNLQYGDAFNRGGCILEILYPDGVKPEQYRDMLGVIRVIDKLFRVANGKQGNEDPWQDIAGYGLLGTGE